MRLGRILAAMLGDVAPDERDPLSLREEKFVAAYVANGGTSAGDAAVSAGYAKATGRGLLKKDKIRRAIAALIKPALKRYEVSKERVLRELALCGYSDLTEFRIDEHGNIELVPGATRAATRALSSIKKKTRVIPQQNGKDPILEHETEIRLHPKIAALNTMAKHLGMLDDVVKVEDLGGPQTWIVDGKPLAF